MMNDPKTRYHFNNQYFAAPLPFGHIHLVQIGRRYCAPTDIIAAHPHRSWLELTVVTGGEGSVITNGEPRAVCAGDIYLSLPHDIHEIKADRGKRLEYDFFSFSCFDPILDRELKALETTCRHSADRVIRDEKISNLVKTAMMEFSESDQPYSKELLGDIFHAILVYLLRAVGNAKRPTSHVSEAEILCMQLMSYIDTHIFSIRQLSDIAPHFHYHYGYLSGLFRKTTGKTLSEYYKHCKMETARILLLEEKIRIGEIAEKLHYSLYSFSKAFKATYGISPKAMQMSR